MTALEVRGLEVVLGSTTVLHGIDLTVETGETVAVLGPSGSGKTTLLYAVAGFLPPAAGEIRLSGGVVASADVLEPPEHRSVGMVFQNYALWPHLDAMATVAYPLIRSGVAQAEAWEEARRLLEVVGIPDLGARKPAELSGGQQQRVGLARALARRPALYLFDEPTAHLDAALRAAVQDELVGRRAATGAAALYATHDAGEALAVADRIAALRDGVVVQIGTPADLSERPADLWTARLTGSASALEVEIDDTGAVRAAGTSIPADGTGGRAVVRADWVLPGPGLPSTVAAVRYRGPHTDYRLDTPAGALEMRLPGVPRYSTGERLEVEVTRSWLVGAGTAA
jgi:ABC-type Fe3+/spermidine/putrescine transport system ATPase subunit